MYSGQFEITNRLSWAETSAVVQVAGSCLRPGVPNPFRATTLPRPNAAPALPFKRVLRLIRSFSVKRNLPSSSRASWHGDRPSTRDSVVKILFRNENRWKNLIPSETARNDGHMADPDAYPRRSAPLDDVSKAIIEQLQQ